LRSQLAPHPFSTEVDLISQLSGFLTKLRKDEEGAAMVEYGLLVALIALVVIASVQLIGSNLNVLFSQIAANLTT
jgi:pilus assembly protein Flp/PilA